MDVSISSKSLGAPQPLAPPSVGTFRSLRGFNYRTWAVGALVSNIGTWMQRTAHVR